VKTAVTRLAAYFAGKIFPSIRFSFPEETGAIYLTFDDGPHPDTTPRILELLDMHEAKATFFCLGRNVEKYPLVYDSILALGHATGNHTWSHPSGWTTSTGKYLEDIEHAAGLIGSKLFRPPYGRITPAQYLRLKKNFSIIMWTRQFEDYRKGFRADCAGLDRTVGGDILVMHDSKETFTKSFPLLRKVLDFHSGKFSFKAISVR